MSPDVSISSCVAVPVLGPATPDFAVDGFRGQRHNALTDHNDFIGEAGARLGGAASRRTSPA